MVDRTEESAHEPKILDLDSEIDKLYEANEEELLLSVAMDLAFIELLRELESESRKNTLGEWHQESGIRFALAMPQNSETWYQRTKRKVIGVPSRISADALRKMLPNSGKEFCEGILYCKNKYNAEAIKQNIKQFLKDAAKIGTVGGVVWARFKLMPNDDAKIDIEDDVAADTDELLEAAAETAGTVIDVGTDILTTGLDTVVPLSLIVRVAKGSFDELCPCCEMCNGKGKDNTGDDCAKCKGTGSKVPFPAN